MATYHKQYPGAGSFVRVIAKTDDGSREIAQCSGPVIGAVNSFTQATEDADRIVAALNAYQPVDPDTDVFDTYAAEMQELLAQAIQRAERAEADLERVRQHNLDSEAAMFDELERLRARIAPCDNRPDNAR